MEPVRQESHPNIIRAIKGIAERLSPARRKFLPTKSERLTNVAERRSSNKFDGTERSFSYYVQTLSDGAYSPGLLNLVENGRLGTVSGAYFKDGVFIYAGGYDDDKYRVYHSDLAEVTEEGRQRRQDLVAFVSVKKQGVPHKGNFMQK